MEVFENDDSGFRGWINSHPSGYVLNAGNNSSHSEYIRLHKAICGTVNRIKPAHGEHWTVQYIKACSDNKDDLISWSRKSYGTPPKLCQVCNP